MKVFFRTDASIQIGSGHVMRCLTLADMLNRKGIHVSFICRELPGNMFDYIAQKGYQLIPLPEGRSSGRSNEKKLYHEDWLGTDWESDVDETIEALKEESKPDWLIIDHYALDWKWEKKVKPFIKKIMVIDDLADRRHLCDLLLDQNLYDDMEKRYNQLVPENSQTLLGPKYALLRNEFLEARDNLPDYKGKVEKIIVFFGGADATGETIKTLEAVRLLNKPAISFDIVVGKSNPRKERVKEICSTLPNTNFYCQVENMAHLLGKADLAIGAGGTSTWERCSLAVPSIVIAVAHNQVAIAQATHKAGAAAYLGWHEDVTSTEIFNTLRNLIDSPQALMRMSKSARYQVDGKGAEFVINKLLN